MRDPSSDVGRYLAGLDGLRGLSCMGVLVAHTIAHFTPTTVPAAIPAVLVQGLTVFFVMSGMLIYLPFVRDIANGTRRNTVRHYAIRRLMRIYPIYVVIFVIVNWGLRASYLSNQAEVAVRASDAGTGVMAAPVDLALNVSLLSTFVPDTLQTGIPPAWSLTTELTFYAALPLLAAVPLWLAGRGSINRMALALAAPLGLLVVGLAGRAWAEALYARGGYGSMSIAEFGPNGLAVLTRSLLVFGDNFALGMVVAVLFVWTERGQLQRWTPRVATGAAVACLAAGAVAALVLKDPHHWFYGSATGVVAAGLIALAVDPPARGAASRFTRLTGRGPWRYLGEISYSVYLWHLPVIILYSRWGFFQTDGWTTLIVACLAVTAVSIGLGAVSFRWVERPAMELAAQLAGKSSARR